MKLLHCADVHLDSPLQTNFSPRQAAERNRELTASFLDLLLGASQQGVEAVLIAGDLFDARATSRTVDLVLDAMASTPRVGYYFLRGNHDRELLPGELPDNLHLFSDSWQTYDLGEVVIAGAELAQGRPLYDRLTLQEDRCNLVLLHGQVGYGEAAIPLQKLRGKHIDYLALGHLHSFALERLDSRGVYCYSGCLEGRGFDEPGQKGYVLLQTGAAGVQARFCPWGRRQVHSLTLEVTGQDRNSDVLKLLRLAKLPPEDLVQVRLTGARSPDSQLSASYLTQLLEGSYYALRLQDETVPAIDPEELSLRGEFWRLVQASDYCDEDKADILRAGLAALSGGEVEL